MRKLRICCTKPISREMSKYCYEHAAVARTFRAVIILFPIPAFLLAQWIFLTALASVSVGITPILLTTMILLGQLFLVAGLVILAIMYFDEDRMSDRRCCQYGWSLAYQEFYIPAPEKRA